MTDWFHFMRHGDFESAWKLSDAATGEHLWDGKPLDGRRVVLLCNRGLGDAIQFIRYVPRVAEVAKEVTVWSRPDAVPLLRCARGVSRVVSWDEPCRGDLVLDIMQLAHVFRTTVETIPNEVPYLDVQPAAGALPGRNIGVGIKTSWWDPSRDVPERIFDRLGDVIRLDQPHGPQTPLETAQVIKNLDLVISADTFFAHLAGALAVPVWTLLRYDADWRWMVDRDDSPWYPTMRLFRQPQPGDWDSVIDAVSAELCYLHRTVFSHS